MCDQALKRFLDAIYMAVRTHVNFNVVKVLLIATPGFLREKIKDHIILEATRSSEGSAAAGASASSSGGANSDTDKAREILENKSKIVVCHSSSGHRHALAETMKDPKVLKRLEETKFAEEVTNLSIWHNNDLFFEPRLFDLRTWTPCWCSSISSLTCLLFFSF